MDRTKEPDAGPQVRFCERRGGAIHRAYSTEARGPTGEQRREKPFPQGVHRTRSVGSGHGPNRGWLGLRDAKRNQESEP
jgi:hypothetical protein